MKTKARSRHDHEDVGGIGYIVLVAFILALGYAMMMSIGNQVSSLLDQLQYLSAR